MANPSGTSLHVCHHERRKERQREAQVRQEIRDSRTNEDQLNIIVGRRGNSARETARLTEGL